MSKLQNFILEVQFIAFKATQQLKLEQMLLGTIPWDNWFNDKAMMYSN